MEEDSVRIKRIPRVPKVKEENSTEVLSKKRKIRKKKNNFNKNGKEWVHHDIIRFQKDFKRYTTSINKNFSYVAKHMFEKMFLTDIEAQQAYKLTKPEDTQEKLNHISKAIENIYFVELGFEHLIKVKIITVKAAEEMLQELFNIRDQLEKWAVYVKEIKNNLNKN